jgi:hypothetical protein
MHAHTRGNRPADPADGLGSLLLTAGLPAAHIPRPTRRFGNDGGSGVPEIRSKALFVAQDDCWPRLSGSPTWSGCDEAGEGQGRWDDGQQGWRG